MGRMQASLYLLNATSHEIKNFRVYHRYDHDQYDEAFAQSVHAHDTNESDNPNHGVVFWNTEYFDVRTGSDYWRAEFEWRDRLYRVDEFERELGSNFNRKKIFFSVLQYPDGRVGIYIGLDRQTSGFVFANTPDAEAKLVRFIDTGTGADPATPGAAPRPFYLFAHECNSLSRLSDALKSGANGIECDVTYSSSDEEWRVHHWGISQDWVSLPDWLTTLRQHQASRPTICAVIFDVKSDNRPLGDLYDVITSYIGDTPAIISSDDIKNAAGMPDLVPHLRSIDGIAIDRGDSALKIANWVSGFPTSFSPSRKGDGVRRALRLWVGNGISSRINTPSRWIDSFAEAIKIRDDDGTISKVYYWTLGTNEDISQAFNQMSFPTFRLDGLFVEIDNVGFALEELKRHGNTYRLATHADDLWGNGR